jgi:hypothetical protein
MAKKELQISIVERVKKELGITENHDNFTLHRLLCLARNNSHPDQYPDELREEADNKCKALNELLTEFNIYINQLKLNKGLSEIVPYQELYNEIKINNANIELQNENEKLRKQVNDNLTTVELLKKALEETQLKNLQDSQSELINLYRPQKINFLLPGITAVLLVSINIIVTLNTIKNKVTPILPFSPQYLNIILFIILLISIIDILIKRYKFSKTQKVSHEIVSSHAIKTFHDRYVRENTEYYRSKYIFTESDVSAFIRSEYFSRKFRKSLAYYFESIFRVRNQKSLNNLSDVFINNLIVKKLIDIGGTKQLDREFYIKN